MSNAENDIEKPLMKEDESEKSQSNYAQGGYINLVFLTAVIAILLKFFAVNTLDRLYSFKDCEHSHRCIGNQAVYRMSFASCLWFFGMTILTLSPTASSIHKNFWCFKVMAYLALVVMTFLIPNHFFTVYSDISRFGSFIFLVLQVLIFVDFAHDLQECLTNQGSGEETEMSQSQKCAYLCLSIPLLLASVAGCILLYTMYPSCAVNHWFISISLLAGVCVTALSVMELVPNGHGLLPPAVVFGYGVFLTWQAIYSNPSSSCNPNANVDHESLFMIIFNLILAVISITYVSGSAASGAQEVIFQDAKAKIWSFHLVLSLASMYMAMALTNWGSLNGTNEDSRESVGLQSMWVKIIAQWLTFLLFGWTLVAPLCCPGRDFSDSNNRFIHS